MSFPQQESGSELGQIQDSIFPNELLLTRHFRKEDRSSLSSVLLMSIQLIVRF